MSLGHAMRRAAAGVSTGDFEFWTPSSAGGGWTWGHAWDAAGPNMSAAYSDTDAVTGPWLDEVGSFDVARQGGGTLTYNGADAGLNVRPAIDFDGTGYFRSNSGSSYTQPHSVVSVIELDAVSGRIVTGFTDPNRHLQWISNGNWSLYAGSTLEDGAGDTDAHVLVTVADGASSLVRLDGSTATTGAAGPSSFNPITIGARTNGAQPINGRIAAVGIFDGDVTAESGWATWEAACITHYAI